MMIMLQVISSLLSQMKDHSPAMNFPGCSLLPMEKQLRMMEIILHLYNRCKALIDRNMPMALLRESDIFEKIISIKYDVANDKLEQLNLYDDKIEEFYQHLMAENA